VEKNKSTEPKYSGLVSAFEEASKLSISFVLFPVMFLFVGVILDKRFNTVPLFIITGVVVGFISFVYKVKKTIQDLKKKNS
jgi:F0F1-type ATP synthase assembly protein I